MEIIETNPEKVTEIYEILDAALHSRRLLQSYGVVKTTLKMLKIDLEKDDDLTDSIDIKFWLRWEGGKYIFEK